MTHRLLYVILAGLLFCLVFTLRARADLSAFETGLNSAGAAYEINPDVQGRLWISDYDAGQVWALDPNGVSLDIYPVMGAPSDARHDGTYLWWADGASNLLGQVSTGDGAVTRWEVPGATGFYGTALDDQGRLWATSGYTAFFYRLDPDLPELCTFKLPTNGMSYYILHAAGTIWLGDRTNGRLLSLDAGDNSLTWWSLPAGSSPYGMALDPQGNLWYVDSHWNVLARLDPIANQLNSYALPKGTYPMMVTVQGDGIWYTEQGWGAIGRLDPQAASYTDFKPELGNTTLEPSCAAIAPSSGGYLAKTNDEAAWGSAIYPTILDANGWQIYDLPMYSRPWGIASTSTIWFVDTGRRVLGQIDLNSRVVACKRIDEDGDPSTTDDQAPRADWPVYLRIDGVRQEPGKLTGPDGCADWGDLQPGPAYGVEEEVGSWIPLTPTHHDFGPSSASQAYVHNFINAIPVEVIACKRVDEDGDLATPHDQAPMADWPVFLRAAGVRQEPGKLTGSDGCAEWDGLPPGPAYGVEEDAGSWIPLTPVQHDFWASLGGQSYEYTFVNQEIHSIYLPLVQK